MSANILVIGSINQDIVVNTGRFPAAGETVLGNSVHFFPGGKGANQAVAAARLGAKVTLIGAVGSDAAGQALRTHLAAESVCTDTVAVLPDTSTGSAYITVCEGENRIIVLSGANFALRRADIERHAKCFQAADVVLCQLELPLECVAAAAELSAQYGKPFILNPAPAIALPHELLQLCTLLIPNQHEWQTILNLPDAERISDVLDTCTYPLLITCGADGVYYRHQGKVCHQSVFKVTVSDTTGAGDTFNGALAAFWQQGLPAAVKLATAAAALSATRAGAQSGMPTRAELDGFLQQTAH